MCKDVRSMKIVHLCLGNFFMDSASYQENMLAKYHVKMGYDVTVIAGLLSYGSSGKGIFLEGPQTYTDPSGMKIVRLAYARPLKLARFMMKYEGLQPVLVDEQPDIIFCHNLQFGDTGIVAKYIEQHPEVRLYADNHADYVNSARNWFSRLFKHQIMWKHYIKKLEPFLTKYYGVTPMRCRFLKEMYNVNPKLIEFLPMGVDDEAIPSNRSEVRAQIRKELELVEDDIVVMTGGKIEMRKNTHCLYEAFERITNPKLHLVVCGTFTPEMSFWENKMSKIKNIHLLGWCSAERVIRVMVASDFVCFPGTHSTLWEQSVGMGLPGIFKHWNEIDHVNVNGNCIFVKGDDIEELADALDKMSNVRFFEGIKQKAIIASESFRYSDIARRSIDI